MNWGAKIFLVLGVFMVVMVAVGLYMVSKDSDSLVDSDYYEMGINFDEIYQRRKNLETHQAQPQIQVHNDTLRVRFVHDVRVGELALRRPSDHALDRRFALPADGDSFEVSLQDLTRGSWDLVLVWDANGHSFQHEQTIYLQ